MLEKLAHRFGFVSTEALKEAVKEAQREAHIEADRERSRRAAVEDELERVSAELRHVVSLVPEPPLTNEEVQMKLAAKLRELGDRALV